jgi:biopolymer transport protein ExbD
MKLTEMEPMSLPPALTDSVFSLLFAFIVMTSILAVGAAGAAREVKLDLPEMDKGIAALRGEGSGTEIMIRRNGEISVNGKPVGSASDVQKLTASGRVAILIEKDTPADVLIAVEGYLKKAGVCEVSLLVKEAS